MVRLGNNEVLKTLTKTLKFVDADAGGSTIALRERCSGELTKCSLSLKQNVYYQCSLPDIGPVNTVMTGQCLPCVFNE